MAFFKSQGKVQSVILLGIVLANNIILCIMETFCEAIAASVADYEWFLYTIIIILVRQAII